MKKMIVLVLALLALAFMSTAAFAPSGEIRRPFTTVGSPSWAISFPWRSSQTSLEGRAAAWYEGDPDGSWRSKASAGDREGARARSEPP